MCSNFTRVVTLLLADVYLCMVLGINGPCLVVAIHLVVVDCKLLSLMLSSMYVLVSLSGSMSKHQVKFVRVKLHSLSRYACLRYQLVFMFLVFLKASASTVCMI